tara:strand:+ start:339 stop:458 length:120 start_codon:yes stop_codon:yes gene_type:complete
MLETVFWVAVGSFVGWNLPQPEIAKRIQQKVVDFFKGIV